MAELVVDGGELVLRLTRLEKVEGLHGDLRVPLTAVRRVDVLEHAHDAAGLKAGFKFGLRVFGLVEVGTLVGRAKRFAAVHHDTPHGVRVVLADGPFDEWIVGCADPAAVAATIPTQETQP